MITRLDAYGSKNNARMTALQSRLLDAKEGR